MGVRMELDDLPPRYRAQAEMQILQRKTAFQSQKTRKNGSKCGKNVEKHEFETKNAEKCAKTPPQSEQRYYRDFILPKVAAGVVTEVQEQVRFALLPEREYCGLKLPAARYTADFVLTYADGQIEVVEVKSKFTRRAQRDYIYRRRLFIDLIAAPRGWMFTEYIADKED